MVIVYFKKSQTHAHIHESGRLVMEISFLNNVFRCGNVVDVALCTACVIYDCVKEEEEKEKHSHQKWMDSTIM